MSVILKRFFVCADLRYVCDTGDGFLMFRKIRRY